MTVKDVLVGVLIVLALAVAADRVALFFAQHAVALQLQVSGGLSSRPEVRVHGVPFLTQAIGGKYDEVEVTARNVTAGGGKLSRLDVTLRGVHISLSDAIAGDLGQVPVDGLRATVLLSYPDIAGQLRDRGLSVAAAGDKLRVTGSVQMLGRTITATAISSVSMSGSSVVVTAQRFEVGNALADRAVSAALGHRLDFVIRVGELPFGLQMTSLHVEPAGVVATAEAGRTVLHR
ncbi:MAG: hypothetical protein QOJ79_1402 [Actinomycetota bacterium]|nr:hypothetical protein [Actinomycetota bacterium]